MYCETYNLYQYCKMNENENELNNCLQALHRSSATMDKMKSLKTKLKTIVLLLNIYLEMVNKTFDRDQISQNVIEQG